MSQPPISRREFLKIATQWAIGTSLAGVGSLSYAHRIEPNWVDVERVRLTLPRLSPAFHGYRMAQISDIHIGGWMNRERLNDVVTLVNKLHPDLIAITGDFVTRRAETSADDLSSALKPLRANDGVVAVLGNHDHWSNAPTVRSVLSQSNITELRNDVRTVERGRELLHVAGVDDVWAQAQRLDLVLDRLPKQGAALLLAHEPDYADTSAATGRFDLQISGHSHGGQVLMPLLGPLRLPPFGMKYPIGRYNVRDMIQYTNRGVGMMYPYIRFNCRPEITLFTLEAPRA